LAVLERSHFLSVLLAFSLDALEEVCLILGLLCAHFLSSLLLGDILAVYSDEVSFDEHVEHSSEAGDDLVKGFNKSSFHIAEHHI
jgi:hypothetical protein